MATTNDSMSCIVGEHLKSLNTRIPCINIGQSERIKTSFDLGNLLV